MKHNCKRCGSQDVIVEISGPHKKGICSKCKGYIKMLNHEDMLDIEREEDAAQNLIDQPFLAVKQRNPLVDILTEINFKLERIIYLMENKYKEIAHG